MSVKKNNKKLKKLLLQAPVWTDKDYKRFLKVRMHMKKLRH